MEHPAYTIVHATDDADFDQIFAIRALVFEDELGVAEEAQIDGFDHIAHHYILVAGDEAVGVARWRITLGGNVRLERLAVLPAHRGRGYGTALMRQMLAHVPKGRKTHVECLQTQIGYFERLGFVAEGEPFDLLGLAHQRMAHVPRQA